MHYKTLKCIVKLLTAYISNKHVKGQLSVNKYTFYFVLLYCKCILLFNLII